MSKKKKEVIEIKINEEQLKEFFQQFSDERVAEFAVSLGEGGDCTYELILLKKVAKVITRIYSPDVLYEDESEMNELIKKLEEIKPLLNKFVQDENNKMLFLDDNITPKDAYKYTKQEMFINYPWIVVRNYDEFVNYIVENGMPNFISFDYELAYSHYTPKHLLDDYEASKKWQEEQIHTEKTGYECALWLVDYCLNNDIKLPNFYCHSMNPVGKDKIEGLLTKSKK